MPLAFSYDEDRNTKLRIATHSRMVAYPSLATLPTKPTPDSAGDEPIEAREYLAGSSAVAVVGRPSAKDEVEF